MSKQPSQNKPTEIGCPGCSGVLSLVREPDSDHVHLVCTIGHSFSLQTLLEAKEEELEHNLWSAISSSRHVGMICRMLLEQIEHTKLPVNKEGLEARRLQVEEHERRLRRVIEQSRPADLGQDEFDADVNLRDDPA